MKILAVYIRDPSVYQRFGNVVQPDFFENETYCRLAGWATWFYQNKFGQLTEDALHVILDDKLGSKHESIFESYVETVRQLFAVDLSDGPFVISKIVEFAQWAAAKNALLKCARVVSHGSSSNYGQLREILDTALQVGVEQNVNQAELFSTIDDRSRRRIAEQEDAGQFRIPTRCMPFLDKALKHGGLGKGHLGLIVAPSGVGKSILLLNLAIGAARGRFKVILFTLEMSRAEYEDRFDSWFSRIAQKDLWYSKKVISGAERAVARFGGRIIIKQYPTYKATVADMQTFIQTQRVQGYAVDLVLVDYWDLIRPPREYREKRFEIEATGNALRGMAIEENVGLWVPTQSTKEGAKKQTVTGLHAKESGSKKDISDVVITISQKDDEREAETWRTLIDKNRFGPEKVVRRYKVDYATYRITELKDKDVETDELEDEEE